MYPLKMATIKQNASPPMFPSTHWSLIQVVQQGEEAEAQAALDRLLNVYYPVLLQYLQARLRVEKSQAEEWLHSFVWKKELLRGLMHKAQPCRGKFRGLLASALLNFVKDELKRSQPLEMPSETVKEEELLPQSPQGLDHTLDRAWGCRVLEQTIERMRLACQDNGRQRVWQVFERRLLEPILEGKEPVPYQELFVQLGFNNAVEAGNALVTAKRMFARTLREVIREYARSEAEVEAEIQELMTALQKRG
jgi:hypothetical protein